MFDTTKCGFIETSKIATILNTMGQLFDDKELQTLIVEIDVDCKCKQFCILFKMLKLMNVFIS